MGARERAMLPGGPPDRWMAEISYNDGTSTHVVIFEEIEDLDHIIEMGPDWNTIDHIVITLNRPSVRRESTQIGNVRDRFLTTSKSLRCRPRSSARSMPGFRLQHAA
jgi:hypothetical protein